MIGTRARQALGFSRMPLGEEQATPNSDRWEVVAGPEATVPPFNEEVSAAWVWTLRHRQTGKTRELIVLVTWRGFDSIDQVPSSQAKEAFAAAGRPGVDWFMTMRWDKWQTVIFHSQTRTPHGNYSPDEDQP